MPRNLQTAWSAETVIKVGPSLIVVDGTIDVAGAYVGIFIVTFYGAVGNGSHDDSAAIQDAIDAASVDGGTVYFPPGRYRVTETLTVTSSGVRLIGSGVASVIVVDFDTDDVFAITGPLNNPEVGFLKIEGAITRTGGAFIRVTNVHNFYLHDLVTWYSYDSIVIEGGAAQYVGFIERIEPNSFANFAILLQDYPQDIFITKVSGGSGKSGLVIRSASNIQIDMMDFIQCTGPGVSLYADQALPVQNLFFSRVQADTGDDNGWLFGSTGTIDTIHMVDCWAASSTAEGGFYIANPNTHHVTMIGCVATNNYKTGFAIEGGTRHSLIGCQCFNNSQVGINTYSGIHVGPGVTEIVLTGNTSGVNLLVGSDNQEYGIVIDATAENIVIQGNNLFGNATGGLFIDAGVTNANVTGNLGARSATSGVTAVTIGNTFVDIPLGVEAPDANIIFVAQPRSDPTASGVATWWAAQPSGGTIRLNVDAAVATTNLSFSWQAVAYGD
jgi:hypothetical protein